MRACPRVDSSGAGRVEFMMRFRNAKNWAAASGFVKKSAIFDAVCTYGLRHSEQAILYKFAHIEVSALYMLTRS